MKTDTFKGCEDTMCFLTVVFCVLRPVSFASHPPDLTRIYHLTYLFLFLVPGGRVGGLVTLEMYKNKCKHYFQEKNNQSYVEQNRWYS